ncbi:hypothetical protein [Streptomyces sp. NBC_00576]|uniref:hypothetical protein n=1 Tax=Streptomyces sp. NBC_00576 TaxID=2903665 RepID=UPI002E81B789|nr:hypothetical protein [Streptomyces sp. NBC_00576]WUB68738.1 hypothetical protein OG734_00675 [Streptomyces sp. NBC_00576]
MTAEAAESAETAETAESTVKQSGVTHVWVPFRDTSLYVAFPDGADGTPGLQALLAGALSRGDVTRDSRYGEPLWRVDARDLHTVVEALWSTSRPVRIHLDQSPADRTAD